MNTLIGKGFFWTVVLLLFFLAQDIAFAANASKTVLSRVVRSDGSTTASAAEITIKVTDGYGQTATFSTGIDQDGMITYDQAQGIISIAMENFTAQWKEGDPLIIAASVGIPGKLMYEEGVTSTTLTIEATQTFTDDPNLDFQLIKAPFCGDYVIDTGEECDDGNIDSNDGCDADCKIEACGDRIVQTGIGEECDDGNLKNDDGCSDTCRDEFCGDGITQHSEVCDDGNSLDNDGCDANCITEACGDGIIQAGIGEQCEDGNLKNNDGCSSTCKDEFCGDGVEQKSEECDDGNSADNDGCSSTCLEEFCGDGIVQTGIDEECDDGNTVDNDGCQKDCLLPLCPDGDDTDSDDDTTPDCIDACPADPAKGEDAGECGCGEVETDTDGDTVKDCVDNAPFTVNPDQSDTDGDGIGDAAERGPYGDDPAYDGNNDGNADKDQNNVTSLFTNLGEAYVTLAAELGCEFTEMKNIPAEDIDDKPSNIDLPFGIFRFGLKKCLENKEPDSQIKITMHLPKGTNKRGDITVNSYQKYGPTPDNPEPHWYEFMFDEVSGTGAEFLDDSIFIYFIDGEKGDDNVDIVEGIIIDDGGPAFVPDGEDPPTSGSDGGGGGCFIESLLFDILPQK
jgi:cysteine-rich repeat protein